jgi:IS605 OrfB family transposase
MKLTYKLKLLTKPEDSKELKSTLLLYSKICNFISKQAFENKTFKNYDLHNLCYYSVLFEFKQAKSQFVVRAIKTVSDSYSDKNKRNSLHIFKANSATYDSRILSFKFDKLGFPIASIWTISGKRKKISLHLNSYQLKLFSKFKHETDLIYNKASKTFFLNSPIEVEEPLVKKSISFIGVDLGIVNIATTSNGKVYTTEKIETRRKQLLSLRGRLQSKGTKSAKHHLQKLSKKEKNFRKDINHQISKELVKIAKGTSQGIALEKLKGIREKTTVRKAERARHSSWSFSQLQNFIKYKSKLNGVEVKFVNPKNTSRECSKCGFTDKANRKDQEHFECLKCGFKDHADINAAVNISRRASVNKPIVVRN